ncbi:phosphatase 2C-like domain-containing protein [Zopfochytrium polystomum]|nr:phosphatase 2C-like domain-containing protein [Zopfochytrium polystomum]
MELPTPQPAASLGFLSGQAAAPKNRIISKLDPAEEAKYLSAQVGEDSYFSRPEAVGVADGVGGWCQVKGANPALYSRKIMHYVSEELAAAEATRTDSEARHLRFDSRQLLQRAYSKASADAEKEGIVGSTTALVAVLEGDHLHVCSLGDCGLMVIRDGEAIFRTEEQQHSFNFPFQLGTSSKDGPSDAQCYCVPVRDNDVVIIGTDGIFDNVFDDEILEIVDITGGAAGESRVHPKELAEALLRRAKEVASDPMNPNSPFQTRAVQEGLYYQGGKLDDVTVLASLIKTVSP